MGVVRKTALGCLLVAVSFPLALFLFVFTMSFFNARTGAPTDYSQSTVLKSPPPPLAEPVTLKLITYNVANAFLFTTNRPERIVGLAEMLLELDPDIVGLQEVFIEERRQQLLELLKGSRLQHYAHFPAATVGNGLLILSAYPISEHYFHRFADNNPFWRVWEGDFWAGKGVGMARIELPGGAVLDFYNTHAQAGRGHKTRYVEVRSSQMRGMTKFMQETISASGLAFVVGDFNTRVEFADLQIPIQELPLERLMTLDSRIDHIFGVKNDKYLFETVETVELAGKVQGSYPELFLGRAPTFGEIANQFIGEGEMTEISDHPGYLSTVRITPLAK